MCIRLCKDTVWREILIKSVTACIIHKSNIIQVFTYKVISVIYHTNGDLVVSLVVLGKWKDDLVVGVELVKLLEDFLPLPPIFSTMGFICSHAFRYCERSERKGREERRRNKK